LLLIGLIFRICKELPQFNSKKIKIKQSNLKISNRETDGVAQMVESLPDMHEGKLKPWYYQKINKNKQ
jgi:hypothetical protein